MALCVDTRDSDRVVRWHYVWTLETATGREMVLCVDTRDSDRVVRWYYVWTLETAAGT